MSTKVINDFNMLFNLVCTHHQGPIIVDFGRQMQWEGIVAGQCTQHVHFLQTRGINAFLDVRTNKLIFSEGSADTLESVLSSALAKEQGSFSAQSSRA